ncbi:MAG TPA: hypothetical protein PL066_00215 [bacterium]|nr:hypothetical protein [bacterium]
MFAEIIPLTKLPRNLAYFDYSVPVELEKQLQIGQIVLIPWRRQKIHGLVLKLKKQTDIDASKTKGILGLLPFVFSAEELAFMMNFSDQHFISPALALQEFWQAAPLKSHNIKFDWPKFYGFDGAAGGGDADKNIDCQCPVGAYCDTPLQFIAKHDNAPPPAAPPFTLLLNNQKSFKHDLYRQMIDQARASGEQILLLFPNLQAMNDFAQSINTDDCLIISHKIQQKKNLKHACWQAIVNNEKKIILGTRLALFYPWRNLKQIVIDQTEHPDYKQEDANPRYHGVDLAINLAETLKIPCLLECLTPRLSDYYRAKTQSKTWKISNHWEKISARQRWINMPSRDNDHPLIASELEERAETAAHDGKNVLILHNRKHFSNELYCPNCQEILLCPQCQTSYVYDQKNKRVYCPNCQGALKDNRCPRCHQMDYQYKQFGLENLLQYWKSKHPNTKILSIEQKQYSEKEENALRQSLLNDTPGKIILATNYIFSLLPKNYFQTIAITQSDQLLNIADFNSHWRLFSQLAQLLQQSAENDLELILQSWQNQHFVMQALKQYNYPNFYKEELQWRRAFDYPPYQKLIKIIYQHDNAKTGEKIATDTWDDLQKILLKNMPAGFAAADSGISTNVDGGVQAMHKQVIQTQKNTRWRWLIWFKIDEKAWSQNQALNTYLKQLPEDFFVDISPENLYR